MGKTNTIISFFRKANPDFGWAFFFLFFFQIVALHRLGLSWEMSVLDSSLNTGLLLAFSYGLRFFLRFYKPGAHNGFYRSLFAIELALMVCGILYFTPGFGIPFDGNSNAFFIESLPVRFILAFWVFYGLLSRRYMQDKLLEQKEWESRIVKAEQLQKEAELDQIRQQLQPHFLFNSLNSINALVGFNPEAARKMTQQLSDFLRGTLKREDPFIALKEELNHLTLYLEIEKVRFGDRLKVEIVAEPDFLSFRIPAMILQPLVENAIKFGLYGSLEEVFIKIRAKGENGNLLISVQNPLEKKTNPASKGTGFGLMSVKRRLQLLYNRSDLLSISESEQLFTCTLKIPHLHEKSNPD
jgi:two-component system LytT family sensor kinase